MFLKIRNYFTSVLFSIFERYRIVLLHYNIAGKKSIFDKIQRIRHERSLLSIPIEGMNIHMLVCAVAKIPGDIAEVGVFQGGTAKIICLAKGKKILHLFDTYNGLPEPVSVDDKRLKKGMFQSQLDYVKSYLPADHTVRFYKGIFPSTSKPVAKKKFSFVNLDTDLYSGTYAGLTFFYPRMNKGGVIVVHDYALYSGVKRAVDLFFRDKVEPIVELPGSQCMMVKT